MKRFANAFVLFTLAACARTPGPSPVPSASAAAPPPADSAPIMVRIPVTVASFTAAARRDYEEKSAGTQIRYQAADSTIADVYVYPGPDLAARCPMSCAKDVLANEMKDFEKSFPELIRLGYFQSMEVIARSPLTPPDGAAWQLGQHIALAVSRDGMPQRSEMYLFYLPGYRVKVRATYPGAPGRVNAVRTFAAELVPALTRP